MSIIRSAQCKRIGWIALIICWIFSSGCTVHPINVEDLEIDVPSGMQLPIDAYVSVDASGGLYYAARGVFERGFAVVLGQGKNDSAHLIVRPRSEVKEGPFTTTQSVDVDCIVETNNGDLIGEYHASASSWGGDEVTGCKSTARQNAHKQAFANILSKPLNDKKFQALWDEGYFRTTP